MVRQVEKFGRICQNLLEPGHGGAQLHLNVMFRFVDQIFVVTPERRLWSETCHREMISRAFRTDERARGNWLYFLADESEKFRRGRRREKWIFWCQLRKKSSNEIICKHSRSRHVLEGLGRKGLRGRLKVKVIQWEEDVKSHQKDVQA